MDLNIGRLRTFVAVAETRSISSAAHRVHRVQSAVSWQIKQLEAEIGQVLFERTSRGVRLTRAGRLLLIRARELIELSERAVDEQRADHLTQTLVIGTSDVFAHSLLPGILRQCSPDASALRVRVITGYSDSIWSMLANGEIDLALTQNCPDYINAHPLLTTDLCWISSCDYAPIGDVVRLACFTEGCTDRPRIFSAMQRDGLGHEIVYSATSYGAILAALSACEAIAAVPRIAVGEGVDVLGQQEGLPPLGQITVSMACDRRGANRPLQALEDAIVDYFNQTPQEDILVA